MTEKNPDAASKLACPEEEIPMGMTPWSQLDEEARARVSRPAPADGQKSPAPGTASVAPEPAPAPQQEAPIPMPAAEAVQAEDAPAAPAAPVAAPVESPAADQRPEAPLSMEAGETPAAPAETARPVPATEPAVTAEEKADGSEAPAEDVAADAAAAAAMAEAPRSGRRGLATMQPAAMDEQIPAAEAAPLPEEGQAPAPQAEAPAAPAASAAAPAAVLEAGPAQKAFAVLAKMGPLALLLLLACQLWPTFLTGGLYCPPEMKLMDTVREALASGQWFAPLHNGDAQLPVFVWMLAALDLVARMVPQLSAFVWPAGAALGGLACLWGTWALSRAAGFGPQAALASGLILLSSLLFPQLVHFMGPQGLATGLCLLSMAFFCMGWKKEHAWISLPLAFLTSGLAALTGGLVFLILPLLTSLVHLFWTWRIRRAQRLDALAGFLLLLLLGTLWAAAIIFWVQAEGYAQAVSGKFISLPWPLPSFWWLAPALAVLGLLPWLFVVTGVNWGRVFATSWKTLRASRKENSGSSFLSLPLSLLGSGLAGATPALCLLAILLGRALVRMGSLGSKFFYLVIALLFLHAGMLLAALHFPVALEWLRTSTSLAIPQQYEALLTSLDALPVLGGLCIVFAVLLARFTRRAWPGGSLLVCTLFAILLAQPAHLWLAPQLAGHAELKLAAAQPLNAAAPAAPAAVEESAAPAAPEAAAETAAPETPAADAATPEAAPAPEAAAPAEAAQAPETPEATAPATDAAAPAETQAAPAEEAAVPAPAEGTPAPAENAQPADPAQEAPAVQTLPAGPEHGAPIPPEAVPAQ